MHTKLLKNGMMTVPVIVLLYSLISLRIKDVKRKGWIVTTLAACFVAPRALMYHCKYAIPGITFDEARLLETDKIAEFSICFFVWSLACDCVLGYLYYPEVFGLLEGWIHHIFYIGYYSFILKTGVGVAASITFALETPVIVLGLGHIFPRLRADLLFGFVFFLFRIFYHFWIGIHWMHIQHPLQQLWPLIFAILLLHFHWFYKWISGLRRRLAKLSQQQNHFLSSSSSSSIKFN